MTVDEALLILSVLQASYPTEYAYRNMSVEDANATATVWAAQFSKVPADIVLMALNKWVATNRKPPHICDIKDKLSSMYWEVNEILDNKIRAKYITPQKKAEYERILSVVAPIHNRVSNEPRIEELTAIAPLLLGGGSNDNHGEDY